MTRNGLLTLVAVLMALALVVRLENTAQAQVIYRPNQMNPPPGGGYRYPITGNTITISPGGGITTITGGDGAGWRTDNQAGTVFRNLNVARTYINASSGGSVISTTDGRPAIQNGLNETIAGLRPRIYLVEVTFNPITTQYTITYRWAYADEPGVMHYDLTYEELPENIRDLKYPEGSPLAGNPLFPEGTVSVTLPPGNIPVGMVPGIYSNNQAFTIRGEAMDGSPLIYGFPSGTYDTEVLTPIPVVQDNSQPGDMVINNRNPDGDHKFEGNARTLIKSSGTAIENNGALTVYDSRIEAGNVGILHTYLRIPEIYTADTEVSGVNFEIIDEIIWFRGFGYGAAQMNDLLLYNTQIGTPGSSTPGSGSIAMDTRPGVTARPIQTTTRLYTGNEILDGRIIVGQNVTLSRNPIGAIIQDKTYASHPVTGAILIDPNTGDPILKSYESQYYDTYTRSMDGPMIGIRAQLSNGTFLQNGLWSASDIPGLRTYYALSDYYIDPDTMQEVPIPHSYVSFGATMVYYNHNGSRSRYVAGWTGSGIYGFGANGSVSTGIGGFDTSVFQMYSYNYNDTDPLTGATVVATETITSGTRIELNDNSWIFADTGISFGSAGIALGLDATRVAIDNTSGIYASSVGITDRYSLLELWASEPPQGVPPAIADMPTTAPDSRQHYRVDGGMGYSGSWHEILVSGKVITGTPGYSGIAIRFDSSSITGMIQSDKNKLNNIFYYDPNDPDADRWGNVYYSAATADKFVAYDDQPNRVFWWKIDDLESVSLTYYDYKAQRWLVNPDAPNITILTGSLGSRTAKPVFATFEESSGVGIEVLGTSMAWEGVVLAAATDANTPGEAPWTTYYGPTVRLITALGDDTLITGGNWTSGGAAMYFGELAHVASVIIGENNDVKNLSNVLFSPNSVRRSAQNYRAFDTMTSLQRSRFLYNPLLAYSSDAGQFHFDNAGVQGDIVSFYNAVVTWWSKTSPILGTWNPNGTWSGGAYAPVTGETVLDSFWAHDHGGATIAYYNEILGVAATDGPSYLLGHRYGDLGDPGRTAMDIPGYSMILDELLLNFLAFRAGDGSSGIPGTGKDSYGYAVGGTVKDRRHYREALARYIHYAGSAYYALPYDEMLAGYTLDGTLTTFSNGDIFSSNIYGSGPSDSFDSQYIYLQDNSWAMSVLATGELGESGGIAPLVRIVPQYHRGNIDLRFVNGTTLFNHNVIELVTDLNKGGSVISQYAGIRVRDVYVESTGHLLLNDAWFSVDPFMPLTPTVDVDYAERLIIHDVLNEGIVSGNGTFEIAQRWDNTLATPYAVNYFDGYFINRGILAPGLPGFIGENDYDARRLEETSYKTMLKSVSTASGDGLWQQLMRGVPGGQFGTMTIFGSLQLMDEHTRPVYDWSSRYFNTLEKLPAGKYYVTVGNDTIGDVFGKYAANIAHATSIVREETRRDGITTFVYDESLLPEGEISKEDWKIIATEKLGTHLSWFSPSRFSDYKTGLPLLTEYEQFEYLTNPARRTQLQRQLLQTVLSKDELRLYNSNAAERARLNKRLWEENHIQFEFTQLDTLLWRYGFSDVISVHGTIPAYIYQRNGWGVTLNDWGKVPPSNIASQYLGVTKLGGIVQADRIYDLDDDARRKEKQTSFIMIASDVITPRSSVKQVTSTTTHWVFANVDVLPLQMESGQLPIVLTVIDDPNYYRHRISTVSDSYNARSVAGALDDAMHTNPGLAMSFQFGLNSPEVLNDVFRQVASSTRANSLIMNLTSPSDNLFNQIGYGHGGLSTGNRGDIVFRNIQTGRLQQPYGQPAVPPPGTQYAPPMGGQYRGQSPFRRTGSVWGAYTGSFFSMGDDDNSFKYTINRNGTMVGNEWNLTPSSVLGGVAMFNLSELQSMSDKVKSHDYALGVYFVAAPFEQFEVRSYMGAGFQAYKTDRYIRNSNVFIGGNSSGFLYGQNDIFGINDHYNSETQGHSFNYTVEFARPFTVSPNFVLRPAAGFEYQNIRQKAYAEQMNEGSRISWTSNGSNIAQGYEAQGPTSGTYGMDYKAMNFARTLVRFGVNTESYFARGCGGWQFRAYHVGRLTGDKYPVSEQSFTSGSKVFSVRGAELGNSYFQVGSGLNFWLNRDRTANFFMNGDWNFSMVNRGYSMLNVSSGFQLNF